MEECYELTLTPNYVQDWNFCDAMRELIQNGTDQEIIDKSNVFTLDYDSDRKTILLKNKKSKLNINTLLLGRSSKANDNNTVGQFGEGYKIAALVLNRLNKTFTIFNNERNEIWKTKFKNSARWKEKILAFYISENKAAEDGLVIEVGNVTYNEYSSLADTWLGFEEYDKIDTSYGEIITDEWASGRVFVNGLSIKYNGDLKYGYNFKPAYINLERDRKTCDSWNAKIITSKMIAEAMVNGEIVPEKVTKMIEEDDEDIFQMDIISENGAIEKLLIDEFDKNNPVQYSVPVNSQVQIAKVKAFGGKPIVVPYRVASILKDETEKRIKELSELPPASTLTLKERFLRWYETYGCELNNSAKMEIKELIDKLD